MKLSLTFALLLVAGCPPASTKRGNDAGPAGCKSFGQSCELSPGKLGTCVSKDPCTEGDCLVCQSQH